MYSLTVRHLEGKGMGKEKESKNLRETKTAITQGLFFPKKRFKNIFVMAINTSVICLLYFRLADMLAVCHIIASGAK